ENQPRGTFVVRVHANDIDKGENGTVRYELISYINRRKQLNKKFIHNRSITPLLFNTNVKKRLLNKLFNINSINGIITTNTQFDYENCAYYRFGIRAYDLGLNRKSSTTIVDVMIQNRNNHVSYFLQDQYEFFIEENLPIGTIVGKITIGDEDDNLPKELFINFFTNSELNEFDVQLALMKTKSKVNINLIQYTFGDTEQNVSSNFIIDFNGVLRTLVVLDRETHSEYNLSIVLYDDELKVSSSPAMVHIIVLDVNDNAPLLRRSDTSHIISINQDDLYTSDDHVIYKLDTVDFDDGMNGLVTVNCTNCTPYFSVDQYGKVKRTPNMIVPNGFYTFSILLRDNGTKRPLETQHWLRLHINGLKYETNSSLPQLNPYSIIDIIEMKNNRIKWLLNITQLKSQIWFLILFCVIWLVLVIAAIWTCCQYKKQNKEKKKRLLISQVRDNKIIVHEQSPYDISHSKTACIYTKLTNKNKNKQLIIINKNKNNDSLQKDDEIEDTSYDADGILSDNNFDLTTRNNNNNETHEIKRT
ncbi:unnamed protein product, partial [Didymodactylos carnosus]